MGQVVELSAFRRRILPLILVMTLIGVSSWAQHPTPFSWPDGKQFALSLSFDDARISQVEGGTALLDAFGVKATFFVVPAQVAERLAGWKKAVDNGHEIGNHTLTHPCSGNYLWSREKALENYTLETMRMEIVKANQEIKKLLGVTPKVFAYPCGQAYVGRGLKTKSYVPLVAEIFLAGRTYRDTTPNDPSFCDFAQLTGVNMDELDFEAVRPMLEHAKANHQWLILGGHEMSSSGYQTTRLPMLRKLIAYAADPANGVWLAPVGTVAEYMQKK